MKTKEELTQVVGGAQRQALSGPAESILKHGLAHEQIYVFTEEEARKLNERGYNVIPGKAYTMDELLASRNAGK